MCEASINMLKEFHVHRLSETGYWTEEIQEEDSDVPMWNDNPQGESEIGTQLNETQKGQLKGVLSSFADEFNNQPEQTTLAEHHIVTGEARPVQLPPYRLLQGYRETVAKELKDKGGSLRNLLVSKFPLLC